MKKQIVINASKDRSRIAIVEDGELVELYIETPDNVRSIGNVYLASIQKVMPALRAAFVDVGQKQDCFLHFSDLTDNLPQLLALAGEDVPGLDEPVLSLAPAKRVADDEDEPDVEDALEVEPTPEESRSRRTSRRRSRGRGRGRGRGKGREEEEEQEETPRRPLPSVIDLSGPSKPRRRAAPAAQRAEATPDAESPSDAAESSDASSADASAPVEEAAPDKKRSRRRSRAESAPDDGAETGTAETGGPASEDADPSATDEDRPARKRRRRGRRGGRGTSADAPAQTDNSDAASEDAETERPPRGQRTSRKADRSGEPASDESATDEEPSNEESSDGSGPEADDDTTNGRSRRSSRGTSRSGRAGTAPDADDPDRQPGGDKGDAPAKKKTAGRKALPATLDLTSSAKRLADDTADEGRENGRSRRRDRSEDDASGGPAADETSPRGFKKPSRRRAQDADPSEGADTSDDARADDSQTDDSQADPSSRRGRRGGGRRSQDASGGPAGGESQEADRSEGDGSGDPPSGRSRGGRSGRSSDASSGRGSGRTSKGDDSEGGRQGSRSGGGRAGGRGGRTSGRGSIPSNEELLKRDGRIIVKITKEAISNKGPRVSTDLSLAGRFLVLVPAADYVAVSKKIESAKERRRLRTLATSLKPDGFGVIVRTVAEGRDAKSLDTDLRLLADKWRKIQSKLDEKPSPPVLLYQDVNMVSSVIRDLFSEDYDRILVDDPKVFKNVQAYVKAVAPQMADKVELHQGRGQVFRSLGIEKQVEEAFSKRVNMRGGGYLFIETTEAMHVVDVNSGRAGRGKSQKQNLIDVNVEAAREVAKQLRLRDLGGIIVVDFIDLKYDRDRRKVTDALKKAFEKDRAVTKLLPMSDFGLVQITRQRLRPSITANAVDEDGERLEGADAMEAAGAAEIVQPGKSLDAGEPEAHRDDRRDDRRGERAAEARPAEARAESRPALAPEEATPQALAGRLRGWLDHYRQSVDEKYRGRPVVVRVHPLFGAYLRRGFPSTLTRWRLAVRGIAFSVEEDPSVDPLAFDVRDQKSGRSLLKKYTA